LSHIKLIYVCVCVCVRVRARARARVCLCVTTIVQCFNSVFWRYSKKS